MTGDINVYSIIITAAATTLCSVFSNSIRVTKSLGAFYLIPSWMSNNTNHTEATYAELKGVGKEVPGIPKGIIKSVFNLHKIKCIVLEKGLSKILFRGLRLS